MRATSLDVFSAGGRAPARGRCCMFVHGGGFVRGNKRPPGSPFYDNIMLWAVAQRHGRRQRRVSAGAGRVPGRPGSEDIAAAVRWAAEQRRGLRRRRQSHLPDGPFRRRHPRRDLRGASGIPRARRAAGSRARSSPPAGFRPDQRSTRAKAASPISAPTARSMRERSALPGPAQERRSRSWSTSPSSIRPRCVEQLDAAQERDVHERSAAACARCCCPSTATCRSPMRSIRQTRCSAIRSWRSSRRAK